MAKRQCEKTDMYIYGEVAKYKAIGRLLCL